MTSLRDRDIGWNGSKEYRYIANNCVNEGNIVAWNHGEGSMKIDALKTKLETGNLLYGKLTYVVSKMTHAHQAVLER